MTNSKCDIGLHVCDNISCINSLRLQVPSWKPGHTESRNIRVGDFFKFIFARLGCVTTIIISYLAIVLGNGTLVEHLSHFVLGNGTLLQDIWPIVLGNGILVQHLSLRTYPSGIQYLLNTIPYKHQSFNTLVVESILLFYASEVYPWSLNKQEPNYLLKQTKCFKWIGLTYANICNVSSIENNSIPGLANNLRINVNLRMMLRIPLEQHSWEWQDMFGRVT